MKRQHLGLTHQYGAASTADSSSSRQTGALHQGHAPSNPMIYSSLHQLPHSSMPHQLYSQNSDQSSRFDPRAPMISSLQRAHLAASSPMHVTGQQPFQIGRRVSLLRDIGRAGERDRDLSSSSSSTSESYYSHGTLSHRISTPTSQTGTGLGNYDRPITMMGNLAQSYQQQQQHFGDPATLSVKQETGIKPLTSSRLGPQPSHMAINQQIAPGIQRQTAIPTASTKVDQPLLPPGFEQKSKEDLVQAMEKVDKELSKVSNEIARLQKRQAQLEETAKKPPEHEKEEETPQDAEPKHRDLWQIIYAENRKKAESARTVLDGICPNYDMPLYNQPCDTKVFQDNLKKNEEMRPKLLKFFQHRRKLSNIREKYLCAKYDQMMEAWQQNTEKTENNVKRKAKETKTREFFEKIFPEIRKQREQQERVDRVGTRGDTCRSDADFADIVDGLTEQEVQLQRMRQLAVVPPMLLDKEERRVVFINNNGFIMDPFADFKESQQLDAWADHEKATFKEKYIQHPKNFNVIASYIEKKSVSDCILYYYLTKKANNFKGLVRKQTLKPKKPKSGRAHTSHHHEQSGSGPKDGSDKLDKDDAKKDMDCEVEEVKTDKPPSPRMTRARKQTMNWTEEEINKVKEGFGKHGRDFSSISRMVSNKSEQQVKNFYHNYKKKHGLDQLITDSKKKKTRSRHVTLSPDVIAEEDTTTAPSRKAAESPSVETKVKIEKDKFDVNAATEKQGRDRVPSPAVTSTKAATDSSDAASIATTHIRTRRTAALAAAAATQEAQEKESTASKRANEKSQVSGEPAEKKVKKNERKSRSQKVAEQTLSELARSAAVKDVVASLSTRSVDEEEEEDTTDVTELKKTVEISITDVEKRDNEKQDQMEIEEKRFEDTKAGEKQNAPVAEQPASAAKKDPSKDHDSSATCSADEENHTHEAVSKTIDTKNVSSPYGFDDDFNDSPTRIRLELGRKPDAPRSVAASTAAAAVVPEMVETNTPSNSALNLVNKSVVPPVIVTSVAVDARPQSLPPASMVPAISSALFQAPPVVAASPLIMPVSGMDLSRPSSTPVYGNFSVKNPVGFVPNPMLTTIYGQGYKQPNPTVPTSKSPVIVSTQPVNVKNIGDLTYTGSKISEKKPSNPFPVVSSSNASAHHNVVDLTKENFLKQQAAIHPRGFSEAAPARGYLEKDKATAKERASLQPETAIPVSSLRFTSASVRHAPPAQPSHRNTSSATTDMGPHARQIHVKEEVKQPLIAPVLPPRQSFSPKPSAPIHRMPTSAYSMLSQIPVGVGVRPPLPIEKSATDKVAAKHVPIPGGSITQGKPVFRAQLAPTIGVHTPEKDKKFSSVSSAPKVAGIPGEPNPTISDSMRKTEEASQRVFPHSAAAAMGMHFPSNLIMPSVKLEKTADTHPSPKTLTPEDFRYTISAASAGALPIQPDPQLLAAMRQIAPGSIMHGAPIKSKGFEENVSPRPLTQRSTPPLSQSKLMERKSSHPLPTAQDQPQRRPSPLVQQAVENHFKEDVKRPSSASRATPERRGLAEKSGLMAHHRMASTPHLHSAAKQRNSASSEVKPPDDALLHAAPSLSLAEQQQQLLSAWSPFAPLGIPDLHALQTVLGQYGHHGGSLPFNPLHSVFPPTGANPLVRPFSPVGGENLDKSRHSVLAQDFVTAQLIQQQLAAARLHFPASLPAGLGAQGQPSLAAVQSSLIPPRHTESPAALERLHFIPQHGGASSPLTSRASPHRIDSSRTTTNPQSPLSPHQMVKGNIVHAMVPYPGEGAIHPSTERRPSRSPHVASPGLDHRSLSSFPGVSLSLDGRQPSPLIHASPVRHPSVSKASHSMPEGLSAHEQNIFASNFVGSTPHLLRQSNSPLSSQSGRMKIKQERSAEHLDSSRQSGELSQRFVSSPDHISRSFSSLSSSDPSRATQRWEPHRQTGSPKERKSSPKSMSYAALSPATPLKESAAEKRVVEPAAYAAAQTQEKANDLKTKGRAKMTTRFLINTIIDHNINQYAANQDKTKQKCQELPIQQPVEQKLLDGNMSDRQTPDPGIEAKMYGMSQIAEKAISVPTRTTTLGEHSNDIIANMYRREPTKSANTEPKAVNQSPKQDDTSSLAGQRFFNVPVGGHGIKASEDQTAKRTVEVSRTNIIVPPLPGQLDSSFESIIRQALMTTEASSSVSQSSPIAENMRQSSTPGVRSAAYNLPEKLPPSSTFQATPQEPKRIAEQQRFGSNSPAPSAPLQMFSALSFRKNSAPAPPKQIIPPSNISGRTVLPGVSTTPAGVASGGVYHPQTAAPAAERTPLPSNQYEPLSDDEN